MALTSGGDTIIYHTPNRQDSITANLSGGSGGDGGMGYDDNGWDTQAPDGTAGSTGQIIDLSN